ncbi:MAG: TetR family transcriptional regulator [Pseudonocardiaceae bacterium]|nr:TetR family transcriptional regulator [Pseudonocardiaceae bacterium]
MGDRRYGGRSAQQRRGDRRERLLEAALDLIGTQGYAAATVGALCGAAGVSTRTFYEEFGGREDVLLAVHDQITAAGFAALTDALAATASEQLHARIHRSVHAYLGAVASDTRQARVAFVEVVGVSPRVERHRLAWRRRIIGLLETEAAATAHRVSSPRRDFRIAAIALIGAVNELGHHWSLQPEAMPLDAVATEITRLAAAAFAL